MFYLKTTKTSLYKLVRDKTQLILWINLPPMGKTRFWKAFRRPDYFLEWYRDGCSFMTFFSSGGGFPHLSIECSSRDEHDEDVSHRQVIKLTLEELQERDMVERVPDKRMAAGQPKGGTVYEEGRENQQGVGRVSYISPQRQRTEPDR